MSKIALQGDASGTGTFTIASPNSNTDRTLTLPDEAGTVLTSASDLTGLTGIPAASQSGTALFSAKFATSAWRTASANGIVEFDAENFDDDGVFNTTTHAFTAPADGVYLFWWAIYTANDDFNNNFCIFKNNALYSLQISANGFLSLQNGSKEDHIQNATIVIPLNSSDTIQVRAKDASDYYEGHSQWGGVRIS